MAGVLFQVLVGALLLGLGVSVFCRLARPRPALCHALWLLVVVKLLVPPVFAWPWQPDAGFLERFAARFVAEEPEPAPAPPAAVVAGHGRLLSDAEAAAIGPWLGQFNSADAGDEAWAPVPTPEAARLPRPQVMLAEPGEINTAGSQ